MEKRLIYQIYKGAVGKGSLVDLCIPENFNNKLIVFIHGFMGYKDWGCWNLFQDFYTSEGFGFCKYNVSHNGATLENPIDFSAEEAEKILKENQEMQISERDALIIGILKVIETDNLIHKFNTYVVEILTNKSVHSPQKDGLLIRQKTFDIAVDKFLDKFPDYWEPNIGYANALKDLVVCINALKGELEKLEMMEDDENYRIDEYEDYNQYDNEQENNNDNEDLNN